MTFESLSFYLVEVLLFIYPLHSYGCQWELLAQHCCGFFGGLV